MTSDALIKNSVLSFLFSVSSCCSWGPTYDYDYGVPAPYFEDIFPYPYMSSQAPRYEPTECKCVRLRECLPIALQILRSPHPMPKEFVAEIQRKNCGYDNKEPLVCCSGEPYNVHQSEKRDEPWVWDISSKSIEHPINSAVLNNRAFYVPPSRNGLDFDSSRELRPFKRNKESKTKKPFRVNFEDPGTKKNRPPSFSTDFNMPEHCEDMHIPHPLRAPVHRPNDQPPSFSHHLTPHVVYPNEIDSVEEKLRMINPTNCGVSINSRIIGGEDAGPGQFPWIARLAFRNKSKTHRNSVDAK